MHFNVLTEPWIKVRYIDGKIEKIGLRKLFEDAHLIACIVDEPYAIAAIHRFLSAFTTDMYCLEDEFAWYDLCDVGKINMKDFDAYIEMCESEGTSFDMFDPKRPFLTQAYDPEIDGDETALKSALNLAIDMPSGNNTLYRVHVTEEAFDGFEPAETLVRILTQIAYPTATRLPGTVKRAIYSGEPYGSYGLFGGSRQPTFFIPIGKHKCGNLFLSMMRATFSKSDLPALGIPSLNDIPVIWRDPNPIRKEKDSKRGEVVNEFSYVSAILFPPRRIVLTCEDSGLIRNIWFSNGRSIDKALENSAKFTWRDPFVAYKEYENDGKKTKGFVYSTEFLHSWRDLAGIVAQNPNTYNKPPLVLSHIPDGETGKITDVLMVGVTTQPQKAGFTGMIASDSELKEIPNVLFYSELHGKLVQDSIRLMSAIMSKGNIGSAMKDAPQWDGRNVFANVDIDKKSAEYLRYMNYTYWVIAKPLLFDELIPELSKKDLTSDDITRIRLDFSKKLNKRFNSKEAEKGAIAAALDVLKQYVVMGNEYHNERYWLFRGQFERNCNAMISNYRKGIVPQKGSKKSKKEKAETDEEDLADA